jgi:hypothetical protein
VEVNTSDLIESGGSGGLSFTCKISAIDAAKGLIGGGSLGGANLVPTGAIDTPYGSVTLP